MDISMHRLSFANVLLQGWRCSSECELPHVNAVAFVYLMLADRAESRRVIGLLDFALQLTVAVFPHSRDNKTNIISRDCFNQLCRVASLMSGDPGAQVRGIAAIVASVAS